MYHTDSTDFFLWCDGYSDDNRNWQREVSPALSKCAIKEMEVDNVCSELKELH